MGHDIETGHRIQHDRLYTEKQLLTILGLARSTLRDRMSAGDFPPPRKIGRSVRWRGAVLLAWLDEGSAASTS